MKDAKIRRKLEQITALLENKKAEDVRVIYVGGQTWIAEYFVIASGNSPVHARVLAETLLEEFKERPVSAGGVKQSSWILLDYAEIMVHIFLPETRAYYKLEKLWADLTV